MNDDDYTFRRFADNVTYSHKGRAWPTKSILAGSHEIDVASLKRSVELHLPPGTKVRIELEYGEPKNGK